MSGSVEVIIPTWNGRERLRRALNSLAAQTTVPQIRVVDNGSSDGTAEMVRSDFPDVALTRLDANLGFGTAINRGVADSQADLLLLINDDAVADPAFVERMTAAQAEAGAEMVCGCMISPGGQVESAGIELDQSLIPYDAAYGEPYPLTATAREHLILAGPCGGAAGYLREAFGALGGFDEEMFAYLEDADLAIRMRLAGMGCAAAPGAFVRHEHSATLGSGSSRKNELMARNRAYLTWKWGRGTPLSARLRGGLIDTTLLAGKTLSDRNLGAVRGWWGAKREAWGRGARPRPDLSALPLRDLSLGSALRRRLARRAAG